MALETLNNRYDIRHFDEGGSTSDPIAGLYSSVLGRDTPDAPGLEYWQGQLASGMSLGDIENAFRGSQEYQQNQQAAQTAGGNVTVQGAGQEYNNAQPINQTTAGALSTTLPNINQDLIKPPPPPPTPTPTAGLQEWYQINLGRAPDQTGLNHWSSAFGATLDPNEIAQLQASPEYKNRQAVSGFYDTELGRKAAEDKAGLDYWTNAATQGMSLDDIRKSIGQSSEGQTYDIKKLFTNELGRDFDPLGLEYYQEQMASGKSLEDIQNAFNQSKEGIKFDIGNLYDDVLGRKPDETGLKYWLDLVDKGVPRDEILKSFEQAPEFKVAEDYLKYLGRTPDAAGSKYFQDQLAAGKTPEQIAQEIAFSSESITANTASVKANLEAALGKTIVDQLTPEQLAAYTKTILDPNRIVAGSNTPATQSDNMLEVYKQIALDPVLGVKLKAENPMLWEQVTPLTNRPEDLKSTERINYGQFGTVKVEGIDVPILNGIRADQLFGVDGFGTISDFSHHRGNLTNDLGWSSNSFSNEFARGAEAIGVKSTSSTDEMGNTTYSFEGLDDAAKLVGVDSSKFQDKQVPATEPRDRYDPESGQFLAKAGDPIFQTDQFGGQTPAMKTISRDQQLYDAINQAAKDIYRFTGDSLTPGKAREGGAESFNTVLYKRTGDELVAITKPVAHGGAQNMDVYRPKDYGFGYYAQGPLFVGSMALTAATLGGAAPATAIGTALGLGATMAPIVGGVVLGATMGSLNAAVSGGDAGKGALTGGTIGGITAAMQPLMSSSSMASAIKDVSEATNGFYTTQQLGSIIGTTLATTLGSTVSGASGDQIFKTFATSLASNGISQGAVSTVMSALKDSGITPDTMAKIARATQLAGSTVATSALSGKNQEQIMNNLISQFTDPNKLVNTIGSVASAKGTPPKIEPTNPFGTENVGMTSGSVDNVLQSQIMDGIANNSDDPIAFMNAAKNWTGNGSENVAFVTTEMVKQGMPANEIAADLQQLYRISADKANEYAQYMVSKGGTKTTPTVKATTTTTTTAQQPTNVVAQTSVAAPQPELYDTLVEMFKNPDAPRPAIATLAQALPVSRYDVGPSTSGLISGTTQGNLGGADPANDPRITRAQSPRIGGDEYSNVYPSVTGKPSQDVNYIRELVEAYKADPTYAPIREELQRLDPRNAVFANAEPAGVTRVQAPATNAAPPLYSGKQVTITGYPELSALPKPVEAPTPMAPEPRPEPMPAVPSPNKPANDPFIIPEPKTPGRPITPIMPISPPGALPKIVPGSLPLTSPSILPSPEIRPVSPTTPATPATPTAPVSPTAPTQQPSGEPQSAPTPAQQTAIQQVAKTQQDAQRLEIAVPKATQLINQGMPRPVVIPKVAAETGVSVQDLATVINATVPNVTVPTPTVVPAPTPTTPAPKTPTPKTPTQTASNRRTISPFLIQQYGGIQDLSPGLTAGGNYSLSGIPNTTENMNSMIPNSPLQQFAATSPASPLEIGGPQQPDQPMQMATGGSTSQQGYNPYDISSGISGSLTPGLTKARLDYLLTGLPQNKAEGGSIEGHNPQFFSEGGLGSMDNTFVQGEGDGTSDQVPAMLANGEFVIPADVVSGLGNGSNDAGAEVLHEFLKAIREHKHSANSDKLPPKSKGALAYLTNAKRKVKVA